MPKGDFIHPPLDEEEEDSHEEGAKAVARLVEIARAAGAYNSRARNGYVTFSGRNETTSARDERKKRS